MAERTDDQWTGSERSPDPTDAAVTEETTVIRAEIVETRERMSDTLDEIGERLNPHVLREQVTERVKDGIHDATIGRVEHMARSAADRVNETKSSMADTIRDNPVPAAMVAVGLGWLMWNGRSERSHDRARQQYGAGYGGATSSRGLYESGPYATGNPYTGANPYAGTSGYGSAAYGSNVGEEDESALDRARERAGNVGEGAKERAGELADRAQHAAGAAAHRAHDLADNVADRTRRGAGRLEDGFYQNPLALGAVTLALGVAAGLTAPTTDREVQLMGGARDKFVDRVKDAAHDTTDKVSNVAERVRDEAATASKEEGLAR